MTLKGLHNMASCYLSKVTSYYSSPCPLPCSYFPGLLDPHQTHWTHSYPLAVSSTCNALLLETIWLTPSPPPNLYSSITFSIRPTLTTTTLYLPGTPNPLYYDIFSYFYNTHHFLTCNIIYVYCLIFLRKYKIHRDRFYLFCSLIYF